MLVGALILLGTTLRLLGMGPLSPRTPRRGAAADSTRDPATTSAGDEGVALFDAEGRFIHLNPQCARLFAVSEAEALGKRPSRGELGIACLQANGDAPPRSVRFPSPQALGEVRPQRNLALEIRRRDGSRVRVCASTIPVFRPGASMPHQMAVLFRGVTAGPPAG